MQAIHAPEHVRHDPRSFLLRGRPAASPECPARAERLLQGVAKAGFPLAAARTYGREPLLAVHAPEYLDFLEHGHRRWSALPGAGPEIVPNVHPGRHMRARPAHIVGQAGWHMADTACPLGAGTWAGITAAAAAALTAADLVVEGAAAAYALCRPPGHHAFADMAGGFCFLNNVAIAAERMAARFGRVAILDVDVHHGNGTQSIFWERPDVFFCSLHADPATFYPFFAGYAHERGEADGEGTTLNLPLAHGTADAAFLDGLGRGLDAVARFAPAALLVSLGLDAQENDPLGVLKLTTDGFGRIGAQVATLGLPTLLVQEGGYLCPELGDNLAAFLSGFRQAHRVR